MYRVLVVDDNRSSANALKRILGKRYDVDAVYDGQSAIEKIQASPPNLVLTDLKMEPVGGMEVLRAARSLKPPVDVIVFTAYGEIDVAVEAMQLGAVDFLTKPITMDQIQSRLAELSGETTEEQEPGGEVTFVAESESSKALLELLSQVADVPSPIWLEGEVGAGRAHAGRKLHHLSSSTAPFKTIDAARPFDWPASGTVLLPSVDELSEEAQLDLHRRLKDLPPDVRVVSTARPDGRRQIAEGRLRPELYYALAVVVVSVPPLRERQQDIQPLFEHTLDTFCARYGRQRPQLSPSQLVALRSHGWPGNVRELRNLAERTAVLGTGGFNLEVLAPASPGLPQLEPGFSLSTYLEETERRVLEQALKQADGDRNQAGKLLGVERNTLRYKLNKYGLLSK